ncbi:MAG TPA: adenylate/guanylate cyclase domain-containing protein [Patescibacteria group bacterium]|nr:adenylate/guanylate cyclase domain-containing protein [Patescibacteria group bacterium]
MAGEAFSAEQAAARAGVPVDRLSELVDRGIIKPGSNQRFSVGDVRRARIIEALLEAGLPLAALAEGFGRGLLSLEFLDSPEYDRFPQLSDETFGQVSERTGVPYSLLAVIRETGGFASPSIDDHIREDELRVVPFVEIQVRLGFDHVAIERLLRAEGDSLRRIAEAEAEWWRTQVAGPRLDAGESGISVAAVDVSAELNHASEAALLAIWNAQQAQTWMANIIGGFGYLLQREGLYQAEEQPPAICFLDITGYTRLTQERGDRAAADLAERVARLVQRTSAAHAGRPVKWLGDGVMFFFRHPGQGVLAALEMVDGVVTAGLPPAHVGLHAGPVVLQEGDYYGQTVNVAARIADYARPGEVLVSGAVFEAARKTDGVRFTEIGAVELKGVSGTVQLHAAHGAA